MESIISLIKSSVKEKCIWSLIFEVEKEEVTQNWKNYNVALDDSKILLDEIITGTGIGCGRN
jgi:hypothetical protein